MNKENWTDGPWKYAIIGDKHIYSKNGYMPVVCSAPLRLQNNKQWQANAHLIAAAPELYVALEELCDWYSWHTGMSATAANAALAKARGEVSNGK